MRKKPVYIAGIGIISSLGVNLAATRTALQEGRTGIGPLSLFSLIRPQPLPVGQASVTTQPGTVPRTHQLAKHAAMQAMAGQDRPPDAIFVGTTTGGILTTEPLLRAAERNAERYRYHGLTTVAEYLAAELQCDGPTLTVSTACSSGAAAIALALRLLRQGRLKRILVGGADSLCRLTYFGFHALQLVDRSGSRPLDQNRQGMSVAEGAAMLLLTTEPPHHQFGLVSGAGLSCDAHHPAAPHPEGHGALSAMQNALDDANRSPEQVGYLNLHGTGTPENDLAEAKAVRKLFAQPPPLSSTKGATGHTLAASGAIEAIIAMLATSEGLLPGTSGCRTPDPELGLRPLLKPEQRHTTVALSNSFGFGGNNCSLVIERSPVVVPSPATTTGAIAQPRMMLGIHGSSCLSGAGDLAATCDRLMTGANAAGCADSNAFASGLPPRLTRRLKRLSRMALCLAESACRQENKDIRPAAIFLGTGWGALSETGDFLERLAESDEQFPSPTDFVGSVHNAPAGQVAIMLAATGPNITTSGGNYSFEQALSAAHLCIGEKRDFALVIGADEGHPRLTPLFDPSAANSALADGGGAFVISRDTDTAAVTVTVPFYRRGSAHTAVADLIAWCGGSTAVADRCAAIFAGIPANEQESGERQLGTFLATIGRDLPVIRYRTLLGEHASASATAAVIAARLLACGVIPAPLAGQEVALAGKTILLLGLGRYLTAMEFARP